MAEPRSATLPRFTAEDLAALDDPYPTYARLRAAGPVCRGGPAQWFVTRYAEVAALLKDARLGIELPEVFRDFSLGDGPSRSFMASILGRRDPPDHTRLRRLMAHAFTPARVRALRPRVVALVDGLLDECLHRCDFDAVRDLAYPLPVMVICELIGIPPVDHELVRPKAAALAGAFTGLLPADERARVDEAITWMRGYLGDLLDSRRAARRRDGGGPDDVLSRLLAAADDPDGRTSHESIVDNVVFLFFAGFETTMNLISAGCAALSRYPWEFVRLRDDRSLVPTAVEELLRLDAPFQTTVRFTLAPIVVGGQRISAGRVVIALLGSANRDERQFRDPDRMDVARDPNPHLSFGGGIHHCLGAALARMEAAVVFDRLLDRFVDLEPAGEVTRSPRFRSYTGVPLTGSAA